MTDEQEAAARLAAILAEWNCSQGDVGDADMDWLLTQLDAAQTRLAEIAAGDCDNCHFLSIEKDRLAGERDAALAERDAARGELARLRELGGLVETLVRTYDEHQAALKEGRTAPLMYATQHYLDAHRALLEAVKQPVVAAAEGAHE